MTKDEFEALAQKIKEGKASDEEKVAFMAELNAALADASDALATAQSDK